MAVDGVGPNEHHFQLAAHYLKHGNFEPAVRHGLIAAEWPGGELDRAIQNVDYIAAELLLVAIWSRLGKDHQTALGHALRASTLLYEMTKDKEWTDDLLEVDLYVLQSIALELSHVQPGGELCAQAWTAINSHPKNFMKPAPKCVQKLHDEDFRTPVPDRDPMNHTFPANLTLYQENYFPFSYGARRHNRFLKQDDENCLFRQHDQRDNRDQKDYKEKIKPKPKPKLIKGEDHVAEKKTQKTKKISPFKNVITSSDNRRIYAQRIRDMLMKTEKGLKWRLDVLRQESNACLQYLKKDLALTALRREYETFLVCDVEERSWKYLHNQKTFSNSSVAFRKNVRLADEKNEAQEKMIIFQRLKQIEEDAINTTWVKYTAAEKGLPKKSSAASNPWMGSLLNSKAFKDAIYDKALDEPLEIEQQDGHGTKFLKRCLKEAKERVETERIPRKRLKKLEDRMKVLGGDRRNAAMGMRLLPAKGAKKEEEKQEGVMGIEQWLSIIKSVPPGECTEIEGHQPPAHTTTTATAQEQLNSPADNMDELRAVQSELQFLRQFARLEHVVRRQKEKRGERNCGLEPGKFDRGPLLPRNWTDKELPTEEFRELIFALTYERKKRMVERSMHWTRLLGGRNKTREEFQLPSLSGALGFDMVYKEDERLRQWAQGRRRGGLFPLAEEGPKSESNWNGDDNPDTKRSTENEFYAPGTTGLKGKSELLNGDPHGQEDNIFHRLNADIAKKLKALSVRAASSHDHDLLEPMKESFKGLLKNMSSV